VTVASPSGQLYVVFSSDGSVNGAGFEATYTSTAGIISTPTTVPAPVSLNGCPGSTTDYIVAHNAKRTPAGLPAVVYSSTVEAFAQSWANTLQSQGCNMQHSTDDQRSDITHGAGSGVGENLYWSMGLSPTWTSIVDQWWREIDSYIYGPSGNNCSQPGRAVGHFTQLAWQCSVYVGCARASCGSQAIAVCNYGIAGNLFNVMPFSSSVSVALGKSETPCAGGGQAQTCSAPECLGGSTPSTPSAPSAPSSYPRCDNSAVRVMQETSGIFSDGDGNYEANSVCQFKIVSSAPVVLTFDSLSLEQNYDFIKVYDGDSDRSPMLTAVTGTTAQPITSSGSLFLVFTSDGSVENSGFVASYAPLTRRRPAMVLTGQEPDQDPIRQSTPIVAAAVVVGFVVIAVVVFFVVRSHQSKNKQSSSRFSISLPTKMTKDTQRRGSMPGAEVTNSELGLEQDPYNVPDRKGESVLWT